MLKEVETCGLAAVTSLPAHPSTSASANSTDFTVQVFRSSADLAQIEAYWRRSNLHPNADLDLYLDLLHTRPEIVAPHVTVLYRNHEPNAMLIGRIVEDHLRLNFGYKTVFQPKVRALNLVWGGAFGDLSAANCDLLVNEIVQSLDRDEADVAVFNSIEADSPLCRSALSIPGFLQRDHFPSRQNHRTVVIPESVEEFHRSLSSKERWNYRSKAKKLARDHGAVAIHCCPRDIQIEAATQDVESIARKTYQRGLGVGFGTDEFSRRRLAMDLEKGRLRVYILYVSGKPCAFWIGTLYGSKFHGGYVGYDPAFAQYSPGMFLMLQVIEAFCGQGRVQEIDFGLGDAQYKAAICNREWEEATVHIFGRSIRGLQLNLLKAGLASADRVSRSILRSTGMVGRVKKIWRDRARSG